MTTLSTPNSDAPPRAAIHRLTTSRLARFVAAYLEMTVSMVIGMQILGVIWQDISPDVTARPDVMALTMAFDMTVGMAAWMWVRRHAPRQIAEMSAVMVLPFLVLLVPYWLGVLPGDALLTWGHAGMFALMAVYLARRPHVAHASSTPRPERHSRVPRPALTASILLVAGATLAIIGGILHPHDEPPNSHVAVFTEYAHSTAWVWIHDLQFLSAAVVVAGFLFLGRALHQAGAAPALIRVGYAAGAATVALIAVNMAVDGVALKHAVDAWAGARPEDQTSRLAAAEAVRWLEWGVNSFFTILLGVTLLIFATALLSLARLGTRSRLAGVTGTLAGVLLIVNGLTVGAHGFEPTALPFIATGLYVVMAMGIPALDRAGRARAAQAASSSPLTSSETPVVDG